MSNCDDLMKQLSDCCELLRGPKTITMQTRSTGCKLNFDLDHVPQFNPVDVEDGVKTVAIYKCHDVPGYSEVHIVVVARKNNVLVAE
jgi:hypothetical protein